MQHTKNYLLLLFFIIAFSVKGIAQTKATLSGYIRDAVGNENLNGASVSVKENGTGVSTNTYGFYSLTLPVGNYTIIYSYVGFQTQTQTIDLKENQTINIELSRSKEMEEVVVKALRKDKNIAGTQMGTTTLAVEKTKLLPVILGEADILKTLQLLPGVISAGEGNAGFYVRGGGADQNLVLLDDAVVYNTGHLFGFFSVFNSDALKNVTLIKGGAPANYGGRLSSVIDVNMKEGNMKQYHAEGGIGLIASRLLLEGPIKKNKGSFMLSGRRTYIDYLIKPFVKSSSAFKGSGYFFYDANLKANYSLNANNHLYLSGYFGRDKFTFKNANQSFNATIPWGNSTATLRWNHLFNSQLFLNTTVVFNDYQFAFEGAQNTFVVKLKSGIRDWNAKMDLDYFSGFKHKFKMGWIYTYHTFTPNQVSAQSDSVVLKPNNAFKKYAHELGAYLLDEYDPTPWLKINAGLRYSWFGQIGPNTQYKKDINGNIIDSTVYRSGELIKQYGGLEPRLNLRFTLSKTASIKSSIAKSYQFIHLVSNNGSTLPTDTWAPSTAIVKPQEAWQYSVGYFKNWFNNLLESSVEVYYKKMHNQIEFRSGYIPSSLKDQELDYVFGEGTAYGAEFYLNKTKGKFTGWVSYTLAQVYRKFPDLNNGNSYPAKYDRRHDLSVVATYQKNKRWTYSMVFIFASGNPVTLPTALYIMPSTGQVMQEYGQTNNYRLPAYDRLDLSAVYTPNPIRVHRWKSSWAFSVYNIYDRHNPYFYYIDTKGTVQTGIKATIKAISIFPIMPSITYNFKF